MCHRRENNCKCNRWKCLFAIWNMQHYTKIEPFFIRKSMSKFGKEFHLRAPFRSKLCYKKFVKKQRGKNNLWRNMCQVSVRKVNVLLLIIKSNATPLWWIEYKVWPCKVKLWQGMVRSFVTNNFRVVIGSSIHTHTNSVQFNAAEVHTYIEHKQRKLGG